MGIQPVGDAASPEERGAPAVSILLGLTTAFVFFAPLQTVQIPSIVAGFSINPARFCIALAIALLGAHVALYGIGRPAGLDGGPFGNPPLRFVTWYFLASMLGYYVFFVAGETVRFAPGDTFFRNYRGRPLAQLITFATASLCPYFLVKTLALNERNRRAIERALVVSIILLVVYGYIQQVMYRLGLPITGRLLFEAEKIIPAYTVAGKRVLRFYSLGGEPRDYGTFIVGAVPLLFYAVPNRSQVRFRILVGLAVLSGLLSASTSAFLTFVLVLAVIGVDLTLRGRVRLGHVAIVGVLVAGAAALLLSETGQLVTGRTLTYIRIFSQSPEQVLALTGAERDYSSAQSVDVGVIYYVMRMPNIPWWHILFGYGFGNYGGGMAETLRTTFDLDVTTDPYLLDTRSFAIKLLVECGIIGLVAYFAICWWGLRQLSALRRATADPEEGRRIMALRYAYIAFFVAALVQLSMFHFILLGLIAARFNVVFAGSAEAVRRARFAPERAHPRTWRPA